MPKYQLSVGNNTYEVTAEDESHLDAIAKDLASNPPTGGITAPPAKPGNAPIYEQLNPQEHPIVGTAQDVAGEFGSNFLDQIVAGLGRPALKTYGLDIPEPTTTAGKVAKYAGMGSGFVLGAPGRVGKFVLGSAERLLPKLAEEGLLNAAGRGAIEAGVSGLVDTPGNASTLNDVLDTSKRAEAARNFAIVGGAVPLAVGGAAKILPDAAGRVINSLIKPLTKDFSYGKNPGTAVASEGITANSMEDLASKISDSRQAYGSQIEDVLSQPENQAKTLDLTSAVKPLDNAIEKANKFPKTNKGLIERLQNAKDDLLGTEYDEDGNIVKSQDLSNVSPLEATQMKRDIGDITKWTDNHTDDTVVNAAFKKVYGSIKDTINKAVPEVAPLNEKYADLTSAEIAAKYRDKIYKRQNLLGFNTRTVGAGAAVIGGLLSGRPLESAAGAMLLDKILGSAAFKTRLANSMSGLSDVVSKSEPVVGQGRILTDILSQVENQ